MNEIPRLRMSIKLGRARKGKREVGEGKRECKMKWNYLFHYYHGYLSNSHHYIKDGAY